MLPLIPFPLGVLVCVVQTLVFCILSTVYLHVATEHEEAAEGHH
jgi:F0F1-type ATP synthase membrane subunit a